MRNKKVFITLIVALSLLTTIFVHADTIYNIDPEPAQIQSLDANSNYLDWRYTGILSFALEPTSPYEIVVGTKFYIGEYATIEDQSVIKLGRDHVATAKKVGKTAITYAGHTAMVNVVKPKLSAKKLSMQVGESTQVTLSGCNMHVDWFSSDVSVAQVVSGNVVATGPGKAVVRAVCDGVDFPVKVTVKDNPGATQVLTVAKGSSYKLKSKSSKFTVFSDKVKVKNNSIIGVEEGITYGPDCKVYVEPAIEVPKEVVIHAGNTYCLYKPTHLFPDWKSSKPYVAYMSEYGVLSAYSEGTTTIQAKVGKKKIKFKVHVSGTDRNAWSDTGAYESVYAIDPVNGNQAVVLNIEPNGHYYFTDKEQEDPDKIETYTVTFNSNGGSYTPKAQEVKHGNKAVAPEPPTKEDYHFLGWFTEEGELFDFSTPITSNLKLTADWTDEADTHTVTFDAAGGEPIPKKQIVVDGGYIAKPADPMRLHNKFMGWFTETGVEFDFSTKVTSDIRLVAHWIDAISITFVVSPEIETTVDYNYGDSVKELVHPDFGSGMLFTGWYSNPECTELQSFPFIATESKKLYAGWTTP